ncbi:MAG: YgjV family protein [Clostridia bacterium]
MIYIIIGNIIALIASIIMVYSGFLKQKKTILYAQTIQIGLSVLSNIVLGGITGAIINALSCVRNILCYKNKLDLKSKIILIFLATTLSLMFNNLGVIGLLPVISTITYILLMNTKDIIKFKWLIIFTMLMWLIYDLFIKSYTSAIFDFMNIVANIISIIQIRLQNKKELRC